MMNRERNVRNRELLLKIEGMKEMDVKNDVLDKGNEYDEYKVIMISVVMNDVSFELMMDMKRE